MASSLQPLELVLAPALWLVLVVSSPHIPALEASKATGGAGSVPMKELGQGLFLVHRTQNKRDKKINTFFLCIAAPRLGYNILWPSS